MQASAFSSSKNRAPLLSWSFWASSTTAPGIIQAKYVSDQIHLSSAVLICERPPARSPQRLPFALWKNKLLHFLPGLQTGHHSSHRLLQSILKAKLKLSGVNSRWCAMRCRNQAKRAQRIPIPGRTTVANLLPRVCRQSREPRWRLLVDSCPEWLNYANPGPSASVPIPTPHQSSYPPLPTSRIQPARTTQFRRLAAA